ncbi:transposase [Chitinispirillum alkaliphilum]|nr:transposase [Chitinispirillum alkaliphilum]
MPREPRISLPGHIHHVMSHAVEGIDFFRDEGDMEYLLNKMGKVLKESDCECYGFALMGNHFHFILRPNSISLSNIMQRVNGSFATYYNRKYQRKGYVYRERFKSVLAQEYYYIRELIRYVHLNPLRANVCTSFPELAHYAWSGHACVMGHQKRDWVSVENILAKFSNEFQQARELYLEWMVKGNGVNADIWNSRGLFAPANEEDVKLFNDKRVKGDAEYVRSALEHVKKTKDVLIKNIMNRPELPDLLNIFCKRIKIPPETIFKTGQKGKCGITYARSDFCKQAVYKYGYTLAKTADFLGINASSVLRLLRRNQQILPNL